MVDNGDDTMRPRSVLMWLELLLRCDALATKGLIFKLHGKQCVAPKAE